MVVLVLPLPADFEWLGCRLFGSHACVAFAATACLIAVPAYDACVAEFVGSTLRVGLDVVYFGTVGSA